MKKWWFILLAGLFSLPGMAQEGTTAPAPFNIGVRGAYGFVIPHRPTMKHLIKGHTSAFEVYYEKPASGKKQFHHLYNLPTRGVFFWYGSLGNPQELGNAYAIMPYAYLPFVRKNNFSFNIRLAAGIGWVGGRFDQYENRKNIAIGSHINLPMAILMEPRWQLSESLSFSSGIGIWHFSNGAFKNPNLGINIPGLQTSLTYHFHNTGLPEREEIPKLTREEKGMEYSFIAAFGLREVAPPGQQKFGVVSLNSVANKVISHKSRVGVGLDLIYNSSVAHRMEQDSIAFSSKLSTAQAGVNVGYTLNIGNVDVLINQGAYLYSKYVKDGSLYHRIGIHYVQNDKMIYNIALKTHWFVADYIEFGIGYRIVR